jgi:hypothetical protein
LPRRFVATVTNEQRFAQQHIRRLIRWFCRDLKTYARGSSPRRRSELKAHFQRIFARRIGFVMLDGLLAWLHADAAPVLLKTCHKLGMSFWTYPGARLGIIGAPT